jgi:hypothetical protein
VLTPRGRVSRPQPRPQPAIGLIAVHCSPRAGAHTHPNVRIRCSARDWLTPSSATPGIRLVTHKVAARHLWVHARAGRARCGRGWDLDGACGEGVQQRSLRSRGPAVSRAAGPSWPWNRPSHRCGGAGPRRSVVVGDEAPISRGQEVATADLGAVHRGVCPRYRRPDLAPCSAVATSRRHHSPTAQVRLIALAREGTRGGRTPVTTRLRMRARKNVRLAAGRALLASLRQWLDHLRTTASA